VPIVATSDGVEYRGSIAKMGPEPMLLVRSDVRAKLNKAKGDSVDVTVALDTAPRTVEVPADFAKELERGNARKPFDAMSYSHQREYVQWIEEAKREETRERRIAKAVDMITAGKRLR
jgi:uncharacterized protein YdeI (YjbR/CyaY-like superfamily)